MQRFAWKVVMILATVTVSGEATGAVREETVQAALRTRLLGQDVVVHQLQQYLSKWVPKLTVPATAEEWTRQAKRHRQTLFDEVVFHGWPKQWVNGPLAYEEVGQVEQRQGYRLPYRRLADLFVAQHAYQKASEVCRAFATAHPAASEAVYFRTLADNLAGKIGKQEKRP